MKKPITFEQIRQARREQAKVRSAQRGSRYAASKVSREGGDWLPVGGDINQLLRTGAPVIRSRIRQLVRDFPYFSRAVNVQVDFTVGSGTAFQSRVRSGENVLDKATCQKIEDAFSWWSEEADAAGRLHFCEIERLAKRQETEIGEFLFVKVALPPRGRYIPFALQPIEADWLTDAGVKPAGKNPVEQGIEYDPFTGRPVAYHLTDPNNYSRPRRVLAENIIHGFRTLRPGQMRGVSDFVSAVLVAHDLGDYLDATIDTAKLAAKYLALITTQDPGGFQAARVATDPTTGQKIESLENAIIEYLRPGEDVKFAQTNTIGNNFDPFTKFVLRMISVATGVPFELLSGDYSGLNYTNLRGIRNDFAKTLHATQARHVRQLCAPVLRSVLDSAVLSGRLDLPGYWNNPRPYLRAAWISPGLESLDPLRETKANLDQVAGGLRSPQEITAARGRDYGEVLDEIAEAQRMAEARGLDFSQAKQSNLDTAPSELGAGEEEEEQNASEE